MAHLGDFDLSTVVYGKFTTYRPSTGATFTLGGTPALSVYKDNSVTQSTTGVTLTADFDSVTGLNHFAIDTSADGTFYSAGSFFDIVITTGTVDSVSVTGSVVGSFTIRKNSALKPATAGRTVVVDAAGLVDANTVKVGPTGSGTAQTAGDIMADTNDIQTRLPAALVGGRMDCSVGAMAANTMTAAAAAADFGAEVATAVWTDTTAGDFTVAASVGKSVMNGVALGTGLTVAAVSGAVGSVTGAVGSVTGNVGGNVVGSVGSVTGAVGSVTGNVGGNVVGSVASVTGNVGGNVVGSVGSVTAAVAITSNIKTNQALGKFEFMMTDSTNHAPATGKTVSVTRSIDGGAFAAGTLSAVTEVSNGIYYVDFGAGDLNGKVITLRATAAGCDDTFVTLTTQP